MEIERIIPQESILNERITEIKKEVLAPVHADWERAHLMTEYWRHSDGEPIAIRRAKALDKIMSEMTINIFDRELIVGSLTKYRVGTIFLPEFTVDFIKDEWDSFATRDSERVIPPEQSKETVFEDVDFWEGRTLQDSYVPIWQEKWGTLIEDLIEARVTTDHRTVSSGRLIPTYPKILEKGVKGIIEEAEEMIHKTPLVTNEEYRKHNFWQGCVIALGAVIKLANRYAALADELAVKEKDGKRKAELANIANICRHVPENPARTFYEAVQAVYFIHLCIEIGNNSYGYSFGRMDQYLYPFYKKDLDSGRMTREEAAEILACFWLKLGSIYLWFKMNIAEAAQTGNFQNITIGGRNRNGEDTSNELSRLIVEVDTALKLRQPTLSLRYHESTDEKLLFAVAQDIATGGGKPAVFCENYPYSVLPTVGVEEEDVYDWTPVGCVEFVIPGKSTPFTGWFLSVPHCLELVFGNGIHRMTGRKVGIETGEVESLSTFNEFMDALRKQFNFQVKTMGEANINLEFTTKPNMTPVPLDSALVDECIKNGKDLWEGGAKYPFFYSCIPIGMITTTNSLYAVKKLVFEDKTVSMRELKEAMEADFEGDHSRIRKLSMDLPKYGNDIDEVDFLGRDLFDLTTEIVMNYKNPFGGPLLTAYLGITAHYFHGTGCGATPDGRKATTPFADASLSPYPGTDKRGPTAVVKSATKVEQAPALSTLFNLKFHPSALKDEKSVRTFWDLIKTYSDRGGYHIQFNVVDRDTLIAAKEHPEDYKDLLIRIAGFSAYFVDLAPIVQDEIISRTEHTF